MTEPTPEGQREAQANRATETPATQPLEPRAQGHSSAKPSERIFDLDDVAVAYGDKPAVRGVSFPVHRNQITALIGPSGCGKSTLIRCLNRMNDLIPAARVTG